MKILNRKNTGSSSGYGKPSLNISSKGMFTISPALSDLLKLNHGDKVEFASDEDQADVVYFIFKSTPDSNGFICRQAHKVRRQFLFNAAALESIIHMDLDLVLNPGQKRTVRLDIDLANPVEFDGRKWYKIY